MPAPGGGDSARQAANPTPSPVDPLFAALDAALKAAAPRQGGLAQLYADLQSLLGRADIPPRLRAAAQALFALRLDGNAVTAHAIEKALLQSGLFLEAGLAAQRVVTPDVKSALLVLQTALRNWIGDAPPPLEPLTAPLPPPYRGAPTAGQSPAQPHGVAAPLHDAAQIVRAATEAALARHIMLQAASLPEQGAPAQRAAESLRLMFDMPMLTPQGTAVVQLRIERDGKRETADASAPSGWRLSFSVDVEPVGAVHARIAQIGDRTHVALVAERPSSGQALRGGLGELQRMLEDAALEPGDLSCTDGAPARGSGDPGLFVDRAT